MWSFGMIELAACMAIVFVAGIVRGWSGFAFAIVSGAGLTLLLPPQVFVPVVLVIELALGLQLVPRELKNTAWPVISPMVVSAAAGTVIGIIMLQSLPVLLCKMLLGVAILGSTLTMLAAPQLTLGPARWMPLAAGSLSGFMNGAFAMGGPPAVLFLSARLPDAPRLRGSIILYFFVIDILALGYLGATGGLGSQILLQSAILLPASLLGVEVGKRVYERIAPERFRPTLLTGLAVIGFILTASAARQLIG